MKKNIRVELVLVGTSNWRYFTLLETSSFSEAENLLHLLNKNGAAAYIKERTGMGPWELQDQTDAYYKLVQ